MSSHHTSGSRGGDQNYCKNTRKGLFHSTTKCSSTTLQNRLCACSIVLWTQVRPKSNLKYSFSNLFSKSFSSLFPLQAQEHQSWRKWQEIIKRLTAQHQEAPMYCLCGKCRMWGWLRTKVIKSKIHTSLRLTFQEAEGPAKHRNDKAKGNEWL